MFQHLAELSLSIAEIIYDNEMEKLGHVDLKSWDKLNTQLQEHYLKVADEILDVFEEGDLYDVEERNL